MPKLIKIEKTALELNLRLDKKALQEWRELQSLMGEVVDDAQLVAKALAALTVLMQAKRDGKKVLIVDSVGEKQEVEL